MLHFDSSQTDAPAPRAASTVILVRETPALEVLCIQRAQKSGFLGGALVFPGGRVDPEDDLGKPAGAVSLRDDALGDALNGRALDIGVNQSAHVVAAIREVLEEVGLLLARTASSAPVDLTVLRKTPDHLRSMLRSGDLSLPPGMLIPMARWVTPKAETRRYDTIFYLAALPAGSDTELTSDPHEVAAMFWKTPGEILDAAAKGTYFVVPPTLRTLELLCDCTTVEQAMHMAKKQNLSPICPLFVSGDPPFLALPGDAEHPEAKRVSPGVTRYEMRDGRFVGV